jgi:TRAP-type C4-dicarboxylate transport system permease small subunit
MQPKDAIDMALKYMDLSLKLVQFFLIASTAIGAWLLASETIRMTIPLHPTRLIWIALYCLLGGTVWILLLGLCGRIEACFSLAKNLLGKQATTEELERATGRIPKLFVAAGIPTVMVLVTICILSYGPCGLMGNEDPQKCVSTVRLDWSE